MATFTLTDTYSYPEGTEVKAYPVSNWGLRKPDTSTTPVGSATNTQTMTSGTLTFTGLADDTEYVTHATVGGQQRYTTFTTTLLTTPQAAIGGVSEAEAQALIDASITTHAADSTSVHGITDTAALATVVADVAQISNKWRTLLSSPMMTTDALSTTPAMMRDSAGSMIASGGGSGGGGSTIHINAADYPGDKFRIKVAVATNATAIARTITVGLYPLTVAGAADSITFTMGTVVAGTTVAFASPAASSVFTDASTEFDPPATALYGLGLVLSGAATADSRVNVTAFLQARDA